MEYRVHRLKVDEGNEDKSLERFLNELKGEVVSILPLSKRLSLFQIYGATRRVDYLLIVERSPGSHTKSA